MSFFWGVRVLALNSGHPFMLMVLLDWVGCALCHAEVLGNPLDVSGRETSLVQETEAGLGDLPGVDGVSDLVSLNAQHSGHLARRVNLFHAPSSQRI